MQEAPSYKALAEQAGISPSYAFEIVKGSRRPSLATALRIYDATGFQFGPITGLDKKAIEVARQMAGTI